MAHAGAAQRAARDVAAEAAVVLPDVVAVAAAVLPDVAAAEAAGERVAGAEEAAGPGRRAGGAAFGASFGLGFPSGPSSSLAWATTIGADCACDGAAASCMAVRAVVASRAIRSFVILVWIPGEIPGKVLRQSPSTSLRMNEQALGRIVAAYKREFGFISISAKSGCHLFMTYSGSRQKSHFSSPSYQRLARPGGLDASRPSPVRA